MAFKSWAAGDVLTAADINAYLMQQSVVVCTSTTRPSSPVNGMTIQETDTGLRRMYDGTNWLVLWASSAYTGATAYTVSFTSTHGPTSPTVNYSRWEYSYHAGGYGKLLVTWQVTLTAATWGAGTDTIFNMPLWSATTAFAPITTGMAASKSFVGTGTFTSGVSIYPLNVVYESAAAGATPATCRVYAPGSSAASNLTNLSATAPINPPAVGGTIAVTVEVPVTAVF